jgi:hypothetical protein
MMIPSVTAVQPQYRQVGCVWHLLENIPKAGARLLEVAREYWRNPRPMYHVLDKT